MRSEQEYRAAVNTLHILEEMMRNPEYVSHHNRIKEEIDRLKERMRKEGFLYTDVVSAYPEEVK